jgi:MEMO1 family protein
MLRRAAVAGSWYPSAPAKLQAALDGYLRRADEAAATEARRGGELIGLVAPHAGLMYSGPVAAYAYRLLRDRKFDIVALVGPSHFVPFEGVSLWPAGAFETPFGELPVDAVLANELIEQCPSICVQPEAHVREHSLEMQMPFLASLAAGVPILPLVMGRQSRHTAFALADALALVLHQRRALLVASSDLSHYHDAVTAHDLDAVVIEKIDRFDAEGLMTALEVRPDHACGGGPIVSVLRAAKALGATTSEVVRYADSGDVSGDKSAVVGYLAAAIWKN